MNRAFQPARTPFDWLSSDEAEVDAYIADPLCGFSLTPESMISLLSQGMRLADPGALGRIKKGLPLYILSGERDPLVADIGNLDRLIDRYRAAGYTRRWRATPGPPRDLERGQSHRGGTRPLELAQPSNRPRSRLRPVGARSSRVEFGGFAQAGHASNSELACVQTRWIATAAQQVNRITSATLHRLRALSK